MKGCVVQDLPKRFEQNNIKPTRTKIHTGSFQTSSFLQCLRRSSVPISIQSCCDLTGWSVAMFHDGFGPFGM